MKWNVGETRAALENHVHRWVCADMEVIEPGGRRWGWVGHPAAIFTCLSAGTTQVLLPPGRPSYLHSYHWSSQKNSRSQYICLTVYLVLFSCVSPKCIVPSLEPRLWHPSAWLRAPGRELGTESMLIDAYWLINHFLQGCIYASNNLVLCL